MNKKIAKAVVVVLLLASIVLTAFAGWSAPAWYTPYTASYILSTSSWKISGAKWNSASIARYKEQRNDLGIMTYWEWEARLMSSANGSVLNTYDYYTGYSTLNSNLPNKYAEMDSDDITIGTSTAYSAVAETAYTATLTLSRKGSATAPGFKAESEWGDWLIIDGLPFNYQVHLDFVPLNTTKSW